MRRQSMLGLTAAVCMACTTGCASSTWGSAGLGSWFSKKPPESSYAQAEPKSESWFKWPSWGSKTDDTKPVENDPLALDNKAKKLTPDLYEAMAVAAENRGNHVEAIKQYQAGLKAHPNNVPLLMGMARAYDRAGRGDFAKDTYKMVIKADPKYSKAYNDLALCLARNNDLPGAIQAMEQAVKIDPKSELYRNNVATMLVDMGQHEAALAQLEAVQPPAIAHYNMGYLLNSRSQPTLAARHLRTALEYDPDLPRAQALLNKVEAIADAGKVQQEASAKVAMIGAAGNRWQQQANSAGQAVQGYGAAAAQRAADGARSAYDAAESQGARVRRNISDTVQQAETVAGQRYQQAQNSVYSAAGRAQANVYGQVDRLQQKAQQTVDAYGPAGTDQGTPDYQAVPAGHSGGSVYGDEEPSPGNGEEAAVPLDPAR